MLWESQDPRNGKWMGYSKEQSAEIEEAYQKDKQSAGFEITLGSAIFTLSFKEMKQINSKGASRPIRRAQRDHPEQQVVLTKCKYYHAGSPNSCRNGEKCRYLHEGKDEEKPSAAQKESQKNEAASDSDSDDDNNSMDSLRKKFPGPPKEQTNIKHATPCRYFLSGNCKSGMKCPYPHVSEEEAKQAPGLLYALIPCRWHKQNGGCWNGAVCPFKHEGPGGGVPSPAAPSATAVPAAPSKPPSPSSAVTTTSSEEDGKNAEEATKPEKKEGEEEGKKPEETSNNEEAAVALQSSTPTSLLPPPLIPCKFWAAGNCKLGDSCVYNHSGPGGAAPANHASSVVCKYWQQGKCNKGKNCRYKHEGEQQPQKPPGTKPSSSNSGDKKENGPQEALQEEEASFQPHDPTGSGRCRSLFIGINYPKTDAELRGCVNDVKTMLKVLSEFHGFNLEDKRVLVDDKNAFPDRHGPPNKKNILAGLEWLVDGAKAGDTLFLHYSGHGCRVPDIDGDEEDGYDEALCPSDFKRSYMILDDDVFNIVCKKLPEGVRLTTIMDCCHSGSMMDLEWSYTTKLDKQNKLKKEFTKVTKKKSKGDVILFSGCKDAQTSADVSSVASFQHGAASQDPGVAGGAATNALAEVLYSSGKTTPGEVKVTYIDLLEKMRNILRRRNFTQVPQLSSTKPVDLDMLFSITGPLKPKFSEEGGQQKDEVVRIAGGRPFLRTDAKKNQVSK